MKGWKRVPLGDVAEVIMGQSPDGVHYNTIREGKPLITGAGQFGERYPEPTQFSRTGAKVSQPGDLIVCIRATIGDLNWSDREYYLGRGVAAVRPRQNLHAAYLWHLLATAKSKLESRATGSTFKQIRRDDLAAVEVLLPPLAEQRRIAEVLDRTEALRAKRRTALAKLDTLIQSIFFDLFGDPATNPKGWHVRQLQEVVKQRTIVTYGIVQAGEEFPGGVPYIRTGDIVNGEIAIDGLRHTDPQIAARFVRSRVEAGDIVMSIRATVGTTALVPEELDGANLTQGTGKIAPGKATDRFYLLNFLRALGTQRWINQQIKGATFREITLTRLRELPVALPPLSLQRDFARRVAAVEKLKTAHRTSLAKLDALFASLQHRAFRGEL